MNPHGHSPSYEIGQGENLRLRERIDFPTYDVTRCPNNQDAQYQK